MPQPYELKNLCEQGRYEQAAAFSENREEVAAFTEWDFIYCINALYKLERYRQCMDLCRLCAEKYPAAAVYDRMGWCLYRTEVSCFDAGRQNAYDLYKEIDSLLGRLSATVYSPAWPLVKFVTEAAEKGRLGTGRDCEAAIALLERIDPDTLSAQAPRAAVHGGRETALPSPRESWYTRKTKLLLSLGRYEECLRCCDAALEAFAVFHTDSGSWFRYRRARCLLALGRADEARDQAEGILNSGFRHWCLTQMLFELEAEAGHAEKALARAGECALSDHEHKMRVSFYMELADHLEREGDTELPPLLRRLVILLREENGWPLKTVHQGWHFPESIAAMDKHTVLAKLVPVWRVWRDRGRVYTTGVIDTLFAERGFGFIRAENGASVYFRIDRRGPVPREGMKVRFALTQRMDRSKNEMRPAAEEIIPL